MSKPKITPPNLTEQESQRFWSKVNKEPGQGPNGDCWEWQARRSPDGYGMFCTDRQTVRANRLAYFLAFGQWPGEHLVCHSCDNPSCCNPAHFFLGGYLENNRDCFSKNRHPIIRGSEHVTSRLTEKSVIEMRSRYATEQVSYSDLAQVYGVSTQAVSQAVTGKTWKHVPGPVRADESKIICGEKIGTSKLTEDQVREIKAKYVPRKYSARRLAREYGMHRDSIEKILKGDHWKHIE